MDTQSHTVTQDPSDRGTDCHPHHVTSSVALGIYFQPADGGGGTQRLTWQVFTGHSQKGHMSLLPTFQGPKLSHIDLPGYKGRLRPGHHSTLRKRNSKLEWSARHLCRGFRVEIPTQAAWLESVSSLSLCYLIWVPELLGKWSPGSGKAGNPGRAEVGREVVVMSQVFSKYKTAFFNDLLHTPVRGSEIPPLA